MILIDYVYAYIYSWYYQMKANGRNVDPQKFTALAFSICSVGGLLFLMELYDRFISHRTTAVNMFI